MKKFKMKKGCFYSLARVSGDVVFVLREGYYFKQFGIYKESSRWYHIIHIPTGMAVCPGESLLANAKRIVHALSKIDIDWTNTNMAGYAQYGTIIRDAIREKE